MKDIFPAGQECGYFVTSERDMDAHNGPGPRRYTVRRYSMTRTPSGAPRFNVDNHSEFGGYATRAAALRSARDAARAERAGR